MTLDKVLAKRASLAAANLKLMNDVDKIKAKQRELAREDTLLAREEVRLRREAAEAATAADGPKAQVLGG